MAKLCLGAAPALAASLLACSSPPKSDFNDTSNGGAMNASGGSAGASEGGGGATNGGASGASMGGGGASLGSGGGVSSNGGALAVSGGVGNAAGAGNGGGSAGATNGGTESGGASTSSGGTSSGGTSSGGAPANGGSTAGGVPSSADPIEKAIASLARARQEHAVVAAAGEVYVIGGYIQNVTDSVQAYSPGKDRWRDVASFPEPLNHGNAGVVADTIYVAGYYINGGMSQATTKVYAYDPKADAWSARAALPNGTERAAGCVAVDNGNMYVIGGANRGRSVDDAARYDAAADEWEKLPALPERREHCTAGAIGGVVYVAGGRMDGITGIEPKTWAFDVNTKTWSEKASLPTPRGGLAGAVLNGRLFVFGGEGNKDADSGVFPNVDVYDPGTNQWRALPSMLTPRHGYGAATLDGRIYLAGGATRQGAGAVTAVSVFYTP